jgi:hypothetical protein
MVGACLVTLLLLAGIAGQNLVTLEVRVFNGSEEVTGQTRVTVHRAGERSDPVARKVAGAGSTGMPVSPGIYDAQAVREHEGRVVNIRWAERLVVMPYPDEHGRHLEVINFTPGYGALEVRAAQGTVPADDVALYPTGQRQEPATARRGGESILFVVRAGDYDIQIRRGARSAWYTKVEVPLDRTRLWIAP